MPIDMLAFDLACWNIDLWKGKKEGEREGEERTANTENKGNLSNSKNCWVWQIDKYRHKLYAKERGRGRAGQCIPASHPLWNVISNQTETVGMVGIHCKGKQPKWGQRANHWTARSIGAALFFVCCPMRPPLSLGKAACDLIYRRKKTLDYPTRNIW